MALKIFKTQSKLTQVVNVFASIPILEFKIVKFKDKTHRTPKFRYWVALRPFEDVICVLKTITTKTDYIATIYRNDNEGANSVVFIDENCFNPPLTRPSYLDCNIKSKDIKRFKDLAENIIDWDENIPLLILPDEIPEKLKE